MDDPTPLENAVTAATALPADQQESLAAELIERIGEFNRATLSEADRAGVARRLSEPARYADDDRVRAFFARHGVQH